MVDGSVNFERVQTFGRLGAELALENLSRILVQVSNVGLEYIGAGEVFATEHAGQAATCNTGEEKLKKASWQLSYLKKALRQTKMQNFYMIP